MNKYLAFYRGKQREIEASTQYEAQCKAAVYFKAKKPWEIAVVLCSIENKEVVHSTTEL